MEIKLPFGKQEYRVNIDDLNKPASFAGRFCCQFKPPLSSQLIENKIRSGLENYTRLFKNSRVLTIVNDGYRRTPTEQLLSYVWDLLKEGDFIVATGTHRPATDDELKTIFGSYYDLVQPNLHFHDCKDKSTLIDIGQTHQGTPVSLNKKVIEADLIFTINSVEPHFFAGFTGGRKSLIPGLASFETVQANHRFAREEKSTTLNLQTNPLHHDLDDCVKLLGDKPILTIQCVTDRKGKIIDVSAGKLNDAFIKAASCATEYYTVAVPHKYDIIIASSDPPLDANLYQLQKAQEHGGRIVKDGGVLIVVGACNEGVGSEYFMKLAEKYPSPEQVLAYGMTDDSFGIHKLIKTARQLKKFSVYYVTTLDERIVKRVYFKPFKDIKTAINYALGEINKKVEIGILDDAGYTVPVLKP